MNFQIEYDVLKVLKHGKLTTMPTRCTWKNTVSSGGERGDRNYKLHPQAVSSAQLLPGRNAGSV